MSIRDHRRRRTPLGWDALEARTLLSKAPALAVDELRDAGAVEVRRAATRALDARNIVYTKLGSTQRLDVYVPRRTPPKGGWPVVLAIHGGGWHRFDKDGFGALVASKLVRAGYVVVAPNYQLARPGAPSWPWNFLQLQEAVRWVRRHAGSYHFDPDRIAAMGESAGGHLAALLGTHPEGMRVPGRSHTPKAAPIQAVVSFYGPANLLSLPAQSPAAASAAALFLGASPHQAHRRYKAASPAWQASPGDAPTLLIHGSADWLVPPEQSIGFARALRAKRVPSRLLIVEDGNHGFTFDLPGRSLLPDILAFLERHLGRPGRRA